ncbi:hypothetical protein K3217_10165 [bacterium BD-1]|nr:hypothetical protein [Ottowia caeni]
MATRTIQVLADHAKVGLSPFVREAIIAELLGRGGLPERPEMFDPTSDMAIAWENGKDVLISEVVEEEYDGLGTADRRWRDSVAASLVTEPRIHPSMPYSHGSTLEMVTSVGTPSNAMG